MWYLIVSISDLCTLTYFAVFSILLKTSFATVINMYFYCGEKIKTNIHLEEPFYLLTKTWKYGGCVFGSEVAG